MRVYKCEIDYRNKIIPKINQQTFDIPKYLSYLDNVTLYEFPLDPILELTYVFQKYLPIIYLRHQIDLQN